jgi:dimethylhistidine N-methyltransferase
MNEPAYKAELESIEEEVLEGLALNPKQISPKFFYDRKGSALFDAITNLDEYYLPHVEKEIFAEYRDEMCATIGTGVTLIEPGAGSCEKVRWLLPDLKPSAYVPMDISAEHLQASAAALDEEYEDLQVAPQVCDHTQGLQIDVDAGESPRVFFYPGSSVGNFEPEAAVAFLRGMREQIDTGGGLLIGVDTKKDEEVLYAAYNDEEGITAEFNVNVLNNLNQLLDGDLERDKFEHHAFYNEKFGRVEMHLRCKRRHTARLAGQRVKFEEGELVHTENSYKYEPEEFAALARKAGFALEKLWQDPRGWFAVMYFEPA